MWGLMWGERITNDEFRRGVLDEWVERRVRCAPVLRSDQTQLNSPINRPPATVDVEFAVDALCMGAHRTQGDNKLLGDRAPKAPI